MPGCSGPCSRTILTSASPGHAEVTPAHHARPRARTSSQGSPRSSELVRTPARRLMRLGRPACIASQDVPQTSSFVPPPRRCPSLSLAQGRHTDRVELSKAPSLASVEGKSRLDAPVSRLSIARDLTETTSFQPLTHPSTQPNPVPNNPNRCREGPNTEFSPSRSRYYPNMLG